MRIDTMEPPCEPMLEVIFGHGVFLVLLDVHPHQTAVVCACLEKPIFPKVDSSGDVVVELLGRHDEYRSEKWVGVNMLVKGMD